MNKLFTIFLLMILVPSSFAWSGDTHKFISTAVLSENFPGCVYSIKDGAVYPDSTIKDFINHHCENNSPDCRARQKASEWLLKNFSDECNHAFNLAVASHYFADSYTPVHWYSFDDCHSNFESCVEKNIESGRKCWTCILDCKDNEGIQRNFVVNKSYLMQTANKIAINMNLSTPFSDIRDCDISFLDKLIDFFNSFLRKI